MFAYDAQIQDAVAQPAQTIDDVLSAMQKIDALCEDGDGLKWFNGLYREVTATVKARIDAGGFLNPAWLT